MSWLEQIENCLNITTPLLLNLHLPNAMFIHNLLSKRFKFELVWTDYNNNYVEDENNININNTKNRSRIRIRDIDKPHYINLVSVYKNHLYFTYFLQVTIYEEINNELDTLKQQMDNEIGKLNAYFIDNEKVIIPNHRERLIIYDLYLKDNMDGEWMDRWIKDYDSGERPNNIGQFEIYNACLDEINRLYNIFDSKYDNQGKKSFEKMKTDIFTILSKYNTKEKMNELIETFKDVLILDESYNI